MTKYKQERIRKNETKTDETTANEKTKTEPIPDEKATFAYAEDTKNADKQLVCTLSVRCDTIWNNVSKLKKKKVAIVPKDGTILAEKSVAFDDGESVFDVLIRELKRNKIHIEFEKTPIDNSAYIRGIANLYEFDCGELSGWMYKVNGSSPNCACSAYRLTDGDRVEWIYTCDLGADVGIPGRTAFSVFTFDKRDRQALCIFGFLATVVIYGGIMNPASVIMWQNKINAKMVVSAYVMGLPFDFVHALSTVFFLWFLSEPMTDKLERIKIKYGMLER